MARNLHLPSPTKWYGMAKNFTRMKTLKHCLPSANMEIFLISIALGARLLLTTDITVISVVRNSSLQHYLPHIMLIKEAKLNRQMQEHIIRVNRIQPKGIHETWQAKSSQKPS